MESTDQPFNPQQSYSVIQQMLNKSREQLAHYSFSYILWGLLIPIISFGHYAGDAMHLQYNYAIWALTIPGGIFTWLYYARKAKEAPKRTPISRIHSQLWVSYVVVLMLLYTSLAFSGFYYFITPTVLIVLGLTTFATSRLLQFGALSFGSYAMVLGACLCFFLPVEYQLLVLGTAVLLGIFVPGVMLKLNKGYLRA